MLEAVRTFIEHSLVGVMDARKRNTMSFLVAGIVESKSANLAALAREMPGDTADKHKIKRVDRFIGNTAVDVSGISLALLRNYGFQKGQRVNLSLDWTTVGKYEVLTTSVVSGGRAIPFHWTVIDKKKTRMAVAERFHVEELKSLLPEGVSFTCLFDAGFDSVEFVSKLETETLQFVVRCATGVCMRPEGKDWIRVSEVEWERGHVYDWGTCELTKEHAFKVRIVGVWDPGQKSPWLLLTNLQHDARTVITYYGHRFETEETYKDYKDIRNGLQLKGQRVKSPDRLARLLAVETMAYWIMTMAGLYGEDLGLHRSMQANSIKHRRVLAVWRVGRKLLRDGRVQRQNLLALLWSLIERMSITFGGVPCT
jgi:hypothetical protein